jgi:hypothetical protein
MESLKSRNVGTELINRRATKDRNENLHDRRRTQRVRGIIVEKLQDITKSEDAFDNVLRIKVNKAHRNESRHDILRKVVRGLKDTSGHDMESHRTRMTDALGVRFQNRENVVLEVEDTKSHNVIERPIEIVLFDLVGDVLTNRLDDEGVDLWSIGVVAFVLLVGYPPFLEDNQTFLFCLKR